MRDFLIRKHHSQAEIEGPKAFVRINRWSESTGKNIWRPPWGPLKKGPTHNRVKSLYQRYEEYEARNCFTGVVPPRGENVTTQQVLETIGALQAEVAASRVEIAASRADNEELRRANEELRRDLQQLREHAVDEHAPLVPLRAHLMSFSQAIMDTTLPTTCLCPKVTFIGVEDLEAHLTAFHTQMMLTGGSDVVCCKLLMSTLAGAVLEWFVSLPDGHITTFDQFATLFREQYLVNKAPTRLSYDVFDIKQY